MDNPDVMMYGAINSLRTGNIVVDMAVVFIVPYMFRFLLNFFQQIIPTVWQWLDKLLLRHYRRQIIHIQDARGWVEDKSGHRNNLLIHAVKQYIGNEIKTHYPVGHIKLSGIKSKASAERGSVVHQLENFYKVLQLPQVNTFVEIEPGLWYSESETMQGGGDEENNKKSMSASTITTITLMANRRGGKAKVDEFVDRAYAWYCKRVESLEDNSRFMYQPLVTDKYASSEDKQKPRVYKRYKLSDEKTFKSLFFPEKDRLLHILDLFTKKQGKYAIKGFPHKLGLLLHGPPGTGKTSLVKAIAHLTGRHIISVPLSRIHTNQELMDVMFDQLFNYKAVGKKNNDDDDGQGTNNRLPLKDVIFLMEDVDAASKIVHARKKKHISTNAKQQSAALERQYTTNEEVGAAGGDSKQAALERKLREQKELLEQQQALLDAAKAASKDKKEKKDKDGAGKDAGDSTEDKAKDIYSYEKDKLSLAGLLAVLDGLIDANERILIMTTNHPEQLDPAILRPGRVSMSIYMGFIKPREAIQMARHYFGGLADKDGEKIQKTFDDLNMRVPGGFKMSPAEFEQRCAESENIDQLVDFIRTKGEKAIADAN